MHNPTPESAPAAPLAAIAPPPLVAPDATSLNPASQEVRWTRGVAVACLVALIVLCLAWELWLAPLRPGGSLLALKALPLCIPLAGLLKNKMYTYRWLSLMVWLYFTEGIVRATSDRGVNAAVSIPLAWIEVVLCVVLFAACSMHVRLRLKAAKAAALAAELASASANTAVAPAV